MTTPVTRWRSALVREALYRAFADVYPKEFDLFERAFNAGYSAALSELKPGCVAVTRGSTRSVAVTGKAPSAMTEGGQ